jgi:formylglycine-generating enzyme required for sulfatase activity
MAVGGMLAAALIVISAIALLKFHANHRHEPRTESLEGSLKGTNRPLPPSLATQSGDMVLVEGGLAQLGRDRHPVIVPPFYIDRTEVTNRDFLRFCQATEQTPPQDKVLKPGDDPVVNVTFDDAQAFCRWAGKRLPTADEWEKVARGTDGRLFPWGNTLDYERANIPKDETAAKSAALVPATAYPSGISPYGALNMVGNAWEWVNTRAEAPEGRDFEKYQQREFPDLHPPLSPTEPYYQVRGGSFGYVPDDPTALIWDWSPIPERAATPQIGFRCAKDVSP